MDKREATDWVISELSKHRDRNDVIKELCQRTGGSPDQVERFVRLIESQNRQPIANPASTLADASVSSAPPSADIQPKGMSRQEATDFVIHELAKRRHRDDIISELCQRTGGPRDQVQRFVQQIESEVGQSPALPVLTPVAAAPTPSTPPPSPVTSPTAVRSISPAAKTDTGLDTPENIALVIGELGKHRHRNDIIMELCQQTNSSWDRVQRFVQRLESQNRQKIAARQSPILIMIGVMTIVIGLGLAVYMTIETLNGSIYFLLGTPIPYSGNVSYFVLGLGMLAGGTVGTLRTLRSLVK
jgi:hypothetical protein